MKIPSTYTPISPRRIPQKQTLGVIPDNVEVRVNLEYFLPVVQCDGKPKQDRGGNDEMLLSLVVVSPNSSERNFSSTDVNYAEVHVHLLTCGWVLKL
jgi:hypothetical protein